MQYPRYSEHLLREALQDTPVVLIHGARQCGKTTLAQMVGDELGHRYISFDDANQLEAARTDPLGFIQALPDKVILDEIQRAPELFTSIKARVDRKRAPGRFILTGSANVLLLPKLADSLAGRMEVLRLRPLARCEIVRQRPSFLKRLFAADFRKTARQGGIRQLGRELATVVCNGGYPAALARRSGRRRVAWYRDYSTALIQRDIRDIAVIRNMDILPKLLALSAGQTARLFNSTDLATPFAISRPTIREYITLLEHVFLIDLLQPWHRNQLSRLIKTPKLHIADTGLGCALMGIDDTTLWNDKTLLGRLLETYIYQELRKQADWHDAEVQFSHYRDKDKVEVDIVMEQGRQCVGIEIKASATVTRDDFKGLTKLQAAGGKQFVCGVVFYDGEHILPFGDKLWAVPLGVLIRPAIDEPG